ncbi:MAG TPA: response regulator transcription factor [Solirubrobacteraceae bacterium]|nr:response regulator transcription factor [Solirubrobacteraceae bacterium]
MPTEPTPISPFTSNGAPRIPIAVLLVDDHPAVRAGARMLIDDQPDMTVVAEARSAEEALGQPELPVDVAVVDYHLGDGHDGLWLTTELKRMEKPPRVLIYSTFADNALAVIAPIAGADGLLDKRELGEGLCSAIRRLARGQQHLPAIMSPLANALRSRLTARDQAIFSMLLHGTPPDVIVQQLGITHDELTVRRSTILRSLKPARGTMARASGAHGPLDYERSRRAARRWAA